MGFDSHKGFIWKIALCSSIAYLCATVPQVLIDPVLTHNVKYGARTYPSAYYFIIPLCLVIFFFTFYVMKKSRRILYIVLPFLIAVIISIPVFSPELPHGNLSTVGCVWLVVLILTLWIRNREIESADIDTLKSQDAVDRSAKLEYLKEEVQVWRMILVGLAGGYFAIIISWGNFFITLNRSIVGGNETEAFILNSATFGLMGFTTIAVITCPLSEAFKKHRDAARLFLNIPNEKP